MSDSSVVQALGQVDASEAGEILRSWLRGEVRMLLTDILAEEVTQLCGEPYSPDARSRCRRAGGTLVGVRVDGVVERIRKPRVRRHEEDGGSCEVGLRSYGALRRADDLRDHILRAVAAGVSTRDQRALHPESGPSRSTVSRAWIVEGRKRIEALRQRDIGSERFFCLVLDGIGLSDDLTAIAALGITLDGRKIMLDFEVGASESTEVCDGLLDRLTARGLSFDGPPLAVLDGSKALANSLMKHFPTAHVQRCLVHKERNVKSRLSRRHWGRVSGFFRRLREVEGEHAAREVLDELREFLARHSRKALESLDEAGDELITLHRLNAPSTLHTTLLSTNCIENPFRNTRSKIGRVKRRRAETDQAERWLACALMMAENGFRRIKGFRHIHELLQNMGWPVEAVGASLRSALAPAGHPARGGNGLHYATPQQTAGSEATCPDRTGNLTKEEQH